jgi:lipopolysaccharide transport system permease protein
LSTSSDAQAQQRDAAPAIHEIDATPVRRAIWDIVHGLKRHELWSRQSANEVRRRYRRTLLGPAWVTLSLVIFALVLSYVWAGLFQQEMRTFLPFLLSGLVPWTLISTTISEGTTAFVAGEPLIKSRQFPYTMLVNVVVARNAILFAHNLAGFVIVAAVCGVSLTWANLMLLPGLVLVLLNCAWMCLLVAIFCLRYRDFQQLVMSVLMIAVFVTPIFFSASQIQGRRALIVVLNPLHHMVELVRQPLLGNVPSLTSYLFCAGAAVLGWLVAFWVFSQKRGRLAYWF